MDQRPLTLQQAAGIAGVSPLNAHETVLGIAEGIETAFVASQLFGVPVWAA